MDSADLKMLLVEYQDIVTSVVRPPPERGMTHSKAQSKAQVKGHSQIIKMRRNKTNGNATK